MKKYFILGIVAAALSMMSVSCDMDRFDFSELEGIEASGQWKLPIGSTYITLGNVLGQWGDNDLVSYDDDGNLQLYYRYAKDTIVVGADFMTYANVSSPVEFVTANPYPYVLEEPIDDVLNFDQTLELESDALGLYSARIRSGVFYFNIMSTTGDITDIVVKSPNVYDADGNLFQKSLKVNGETPIDMSGFLLETGEENTIHFYYDIYYQAYTYTGANFVFTGYITVDQLRIQEMRGFVKSYSAPFRVLDTNFCLPFDHVDGAMDFVEAHLMIKDRNTFNLPCELIIDTAMIFGEDVESIELFDHYPYNLFVNYSLDYTDLFDQTFRIGMNTKHQQFLSSGTFIMNPEDRNGMVVICDTSTIGISAEGILPLKFNIPGVTYNDTVDVDFSEIQAPEVIQEVQLTLLFESELPFNLGAQLYTTDPETGMVTDSLFTHSHMIKGAFDGGIERTEAVVVMSKARLSKLMASEQMLLRLDVDTDDNEVQLNLEDGIRLTMKVDVLYDGDLVDIQND